jgi:integrase/recombinase XerD
MNEITKVDVLILPDGPNMSRNVTAVFLASKRLSTRETYRLDLQLMAGLLGVDDIFFCNWSALRYAHTQAIRTMLMEIVSKATGKPLASAYINRLLSALRGVLKTAWRLGYINSEQEAGGWERFLDG